MDIFLDGHWRLEFGLDLVLIKSMDFNASYIPSSSSAQISMTQKNYSVISTL